MSISFGATRNLTATFLRYRVEHKKKKDRFGAYNLLGSSAPFQILERRTSGSTPSELVTEKTSGVGFSDQDHLHGTDASATAASQQHLLSPGNASSMSPLRHFGTSGHPSSGPHSTVRIEMSDLHSKASLPPLWIDTVEEVQDSIGRIKERLSVLQKAQQRQLLRIFGDKSSLSQPEQEIGKLSDFITQLFRQAENRVKQLKSCDSENETNKKLHLNAQSSLASQLQALSQQFRKQQKHFAAELSKRSIGSPENNGGSNSSSVDFRGPDGQSKSLTYLEKEKQGFNEDQLLQLQDIEHTVESRDEEVSYIARSIAEMHTIFKELAVLVVDQGTILDRIDFNVEKVVEQTRQANIHLKKAEERQSSPRAARVIMFLLASIIFLALLFIWKHM